MAKVIFKEEIFNNLEDEKRQRLLNFLFFLDECKLDEEIHYKIKTKFMDEFNGFYRFIKREYNKIC